MSIESTTIQVKNLSGVHLRVAAKISREVLQSGCKVRIIKGDASADASSPMEILTLAIQGGENIVVEAKGKNAKKILKKIEEILSNHEY